MFFPLLIKLPALSRVRDAYIFIANNDYSALA